ncbi:MAG: response regulator [Desulfuromonadales bacterium]
MKINNRLDQHYLKTLTILYVEDDDDTRKQFSEFLKRPVGTLITASNGVEGLEAFKKHAPDIVLTDILMPKMDGLTMAHEIRGISPTVPIIVITAFEQTDYMMRAINIGIDKYVTKPVNSYLLFECLLECAHSLRAEQQLKLQHQREIQEAWSKHNETVAILAGGMAHDYNNLMQAILGYVSLAKMKLEPDSESSRYLEQVEKSSGEACQLGHMLAILGNSYTENMKRGAVMPCISAAILNALSGTSVELHPDYPEDLPDISFSEQQIQLVFSGLAINAAEAMPSGGALRLAAEVVEITDEDFVPMETGTYIHISVIDSGSGISSEVLPRIFAPYFSTKQRSSKRGMGLNLALCRTVIMKHGGTIAAESVPGEGTTFQIWLPAIL